MASVKELRDKMRGLAELAQSVVKDADLNGGEKRSKLDKVEEEIKATESELRDREYLDEKGAQFDFLIDANTNASNTGAGEGIDVFGAPNNPDSQVVPLKNGSVAETLYGTKSFQEYLQDIKIGAHTQSRAVEVPVWNQKATLTTAADSGGTLVVPARRPGILDILVERLTVADLMAQSGIDSNSLDVPVQTGRTNAASPTGEGVEKLESALTFDVVTEPVRKLATVLKVTDEMLADYSAIRGFIDQQLMQFVLEEEEQQILSGSGSNPELTGILNRSILEQPKGSDSVVDALYKGISKIRREGFIEPTGMVINSTDWEAIRLAKDENLQYYGGGPFTGAYGNGGGLAPDMLWGKPVVVTSSITEGTALVGAFRTASQLFRKQNITIQMSNSNEDDFIKNLVTLRAEERVLLAVFRLKGFAKVTSI